MFIHMMLAVHPPSNHVQHVVSSVLADLVEIFDKGSTWILAARVSLVRLSINRVLFLSEPLAGKNLNCKHKTQSS